MLSPSMMTMSKGNRWCHRSIWFATSYSGCSPVPLSPNAAYFSESGLLGSVSSWAWTPNRRTAATPTTATTATAARRMQRLARSFLLRELVTVGDLLVESPDESGRHRRLKAAGSERILPLPIRQGPQQVARPAHVSRCDPMLEELLVPTVIAELH